MVQCIFSGGARYQVAINVLGDTGVGKTSLVTSLEAGTACLTREEDRTVGANIKKVVHKDVDFYFCDVGGHPCYLSFHQFYISGFAVNVLVVEVRDPLDPKKFRKELREQLNRWIDLVSSKQEKSLFLVTISKCERFPKEQLEEVIEAIKEEIRDIQKHAVSLIDMSIKDLEATIERLKGDEKPGYSTVKRNIDAAKAAKNGQPIIENEVICISCESGCGLEEILDKCVAMVKNCEDKNRFFKLSEYPKAWESFMKKLLNSRKSGSLALTMDEVKSKAQEAGLQLHEVKPCLFLFMITGHVLYYENTKHSLTKWVFHNPNELLERLGHIFHHDLKGKLEKYLRSKTTDISSSLDRLTDEGLVPYDFIADLIMTSATSDGTVSPLVVAEGVLRLARNTGLCVEVEPDDKHRERRVFIPSMVSRDKEDVPGLDEDWPDNPPADYVDFSMELHLIRPDLPPGLLHRMAVEMNSYTKRKQIWRNGLCAKGTKCDVFVDASPSKDLDVPDSVTSVTFKVRAKKSSPESAIEDLTYLYWVCQRTMSFFTGILCTMVTRCHMRPRHLFFVDDCLNKTSEELKELECPSCPHRLGSTAALCFPARGQFSPGKISVHLCYP